MRACPLLHHSRKGCRLEQPPKTSSRVVTSALLCLFVATGALLPYSGPYSANSIACNQSMYCWCCKPSLHSFYPGVCRSPVCRTAAIPPVPISALLHGARSRTAVTHSIMAPPTKDKKGKADGAKGKSKGDAVKSKVRAPTVHHRTHSPSCLKVLLVRY